MTGSIMLTNPARWMLALTALIIPWLVFVSDRSTAWVIAPVALAAVVAGLARKGRSSASSTPTSLILSLGGLLGITLLAVGSPLWGPDTLQTGMQKQAWRMMPAMLAGLLLIWSVTRLRTDATGALKALKIGCGLAVAIALVDTLSGRWLLRIRHTVGESGFDGDVLVRAEAYELAEFLARFNDFWVIATLSLALLITLTTRGWVMLAGLLGLAAASLFTISETSLVMALAGFVAALLTWAIGRRAVHLISAAIVVAIATTPWLFPVLDRAAAQFISGGSTITHKIRERLEIWGALSKTVPENLLLGHGIAYQRLTLDYPGPGEFFIPDKLFHPHSIFVQIWQDLGMLGAALLCISVVGIFRAISEAPERYQAGLAAMAVMVMAALGAAHSIWLGWWLCAFFLVAALTIHFVRQSEQHG